MKCCRVRVMPVCFSLIFTALSSFPLVAAAGWQVSAPIAGAPRELAYQPSPHPVTFTPRPQYAAPPFHPAYEKQDIAFAPRPWHRRGHTHLTWKGEAPVATAEPYFNAGTQTDRAFTPIINDGNLGTPAPMYAISVSGSLKHNVERIMRRYGWKVIWKVPVDYNFDGRITGATLPEVMTKLFKPFPLQAQMFMANQRMIVVQRIV